MSGRGHAYAFWRGATRAQPAAVVGALFIATVQLGALAFHLTPDRIAQMNPGRLMAHPRDADAHASVLAHRLERGPPIDGVILVGASQFLYIIDDPNRYADDLSRAVGRPQSFQHLAFPAQTLWEQAMLLEGLPAKSRGVVAIGTRFWLARHKPDELKRVYDRTRVAHSSALVNEMLPRYGLEPRFETGIAFLDFRKFFGVRGRISPRLLWQKPHTLFTRPYDGRVMSPDRYRKYFVAYAKGFSAPRTVDPKQAELLKQLVGHLRQRGFQVALVASPINPVLETIHESTISALRDQQRALALSVGAHWIDVRAKVDLDIHEFYDLTHVNSPLARVRFRKELVAELVPLLADE